MLRKLTLKHFTVFENATFEFVDGLNVIVGENGTGKSHVLKAAYSSIAVSCRGQKESKSPKPTSKHLSSALAKKLMGVFRPWQLGRLASRQPVETKSSVRSEFKDRTLNIGYSFGSNAEDLVAIEELPAKWEPYTPVFIPTRELLTIAPGFVSLYDNYDFQFEETWRDTCSLLEKRLAKGPRAEDLKPLLRPLEVLLGGRVLLDSRGFCLKLDIGKMEAHLAAEGLRKLAMLARLIATRSLTEKGYLYWDEPEANLNPKLIKKIAISIVQLCKAGIQIVIATHSLFLLRELEMLLKQKAYREVPAHYMGLHPGDHGVEVLQGDSVDDMGDLDMLNEELMQSDRYLEVVLK